MIVVAAQKVREAFEEGFRVGRRAGLADASNAVEEIRARLMPKRAKGLLDAPK